MERLRPTVQFVSIGLLMLGLLCVPVGFGVSPKRDLSAFSNAADLGMFLKPALGLVFFGVLSFLASFLLPGSNIWDEEI